MAAKKTLQKPGILTCKKQLTKRKGLNIYFHNSNQFSETIKDSSLDAIIAADSLEHIKDLDKYLEIFKNKLNAEGKLIISGPTENIIYKLGRIIAGFNDKEEYHETNINDLIPKISSLGFEVKKITNLPFKLPPYLFKVVVFKMT